MPGALEIDPASNLLLACVPAAERQELVPWLEPVRLPLRQHIYEAQEPIRYVHFPTTGLVSVIAISREGSTVEVGPVGCDGMVGLPVFLGGRTDPLEAFVQIGPVDALRMPAQAFVDAAERLPGLQHVMRLYTQWSYYSMAQWVLCARLHPIEERLGRWLAMCHDRVGRDCFPLNHEFMAEMLGVRRAGVTLAAGTLREAGLIDYRRGEVVIVARAALENASCECNRATAAEYQRLFGRPPRHPAASGQFMLGGALANHV